MNKVLIIEDDEDLAKGLETKLQEEGFEVTVAYDGEKGSEQAIALKPDAMIIDIILPGKKDGIAVLKEIRNDDWGKNVPVLILTNMDDMEHVSQAVEYQSDYIVKSAASLDEIVARLKVKLHV